MAAAEFMLVYSLMKVVRTMLAGTVFMAIACLACGISRNRSWRLNLGVLSLVPLACLTGYSKIFFRGKLLLLTALINERLSAEAAALYFAAAGMLACRHFYIQHRLRRSLRQMQVYEENHTKGCGLPCNKRHQIRIYLSQDSLGPFAGGVIRPYIVLPKALADSLSSGELSALIHHEVLHIQLGHVLFLQIYALLKILWWAHPLIYVCDRRLRENIEYSSDEGSVLFGPLNAYEYGSLMMKLLNGIQKRFVREGMAAFSTGSYAVLKKRIEKIAAVRRQEAARIAYRRKKRMLHAACGAAIAAASVFILAFSYPRYTRVREISVFDENVNLLTNDLRAEGIRADVRDGMIHISRAELNKIVSRYRPRGDYVVFSYDTIMKVPGVGGGGQSAMVSLSDPSDVFLMGRYEFADELAVFIMKYFI